MTQFNHGAFMAVLRKRRGAVPKPLYDDIMAALEAGLSGAPAPTKVGSEPPWVAAGRTKIGEREIPGPKHNSWIANGWAKLGAKWFNDDETPWCGFFVAWCMQQAELDYPPKGEFARAKAWADWGNPMTSPAVGTVGVKSRTGGGHVFIIIGETPDKRSFKVLEGNANNMVRIGDVPKAAVEAMRWPKGVPLPLDRTLPQMPAGAFATSEA